MLSRQHVLNPEFAIDLRSQGSMLVLRWYLLVDHDSQPVSYQRREDEEARKKFLLIKYQYEQVWAFLSFDVNDQRPIMSFPLSCPEQLCLINDGLLHSNSYVVFTCRFDDEARHV